MSEEEDKKALRELIARALVMVEALENIEHRVGIVIEGGRQQLGHLVGDLRIRELHLELRQINSELKRINIK